MHNQGGPAVSFKSFEDSYRVCKMNNKKECMVYNIFYLVVGFSFKYIKSFLANLGTGTIMNGEDL